MWDHSDVLTLMILSSKLSARIFLRSAIHQARFGSARCEIQPPRGVQLHPLHRSSLSKMAEFGTGTAATATTAVQQPLVMQIVVRRDLLDVRLKLSQDYLPPYTCADVDITYACVVFDAFPQDRLKAGASAR